ncbi:interleukin-1 receptor-like 1 isoform X2 [Takifugu rubripes]|nr:interleukin-1 receptor-like 1 isoform X2 [Takifugu rubripes]
MDTLRLLFLIVMATSACDCAVMQMCEKHNSEFFNLLEGEAFLFQPWEIETDLYEVKWYRNVTQPEPISTEENQRVHYHGKTLFFLKVQPEDAGVYFAQHSDEDGRCHNYNVSIKVFRSENDTKLLYGKIKNSDSNMKVPCPGWVKSICDDHNGTFSWMKDFKPLKDQNKNDLLIKDAKKKHEGVYTCVCTWMHNQTVYRSSGSRRLIKEEQRVHRDPQILVPETSEVLADKGLEKKLNCSVFCGVNVFGQCNARWEVTGRSIQTDGYSQSINNVMDNSSKVTTSTAVLTIGKVSGRDFQTTFTCIGMGLFKTESRNITLRQRGIYFSFDVQNVSILLSCLLVAVLLKCFFIDIVLLVRPCLSQINRKTDTRMYDAFVIYQMECENTLQQFITKILPSVLEDKYRYRLFIHGRDDLPGQDHLEQVESCVQQSKTLMFVLTPASGSELTEQHPAGCQYSGTEGFSLHIVLHHALIQSDIGVILIQIGDTVPGGFTHLPPGLQHLIMKSAPLRWRHESRWAAARNFRFWKKVRYLMPAVPAAKR